MDSLLANYASSSDDDGDDHHEKEGSQQPPSSISVELPPPKSKPSLFSALPPPKTLASSSPSLFSSLPPPKSQHPDPSPAPPIPSPVPKIEPNESPNRTKKPIFSSLPPPKSEPSNPRIPIKRVVQFTLPLNPSLLKPNDLDGDGDEEEEEEEERKPIEGSSNSAPSKGLSSMLPAPKHSLCLAPSAASRRSIFETSVSSSNTESVEKKQESSNFDSYGGSKAESFRSEEQEAVSFEEYGSYPLEQGVSGHEHYASYEGNLAANGLGVASYETSYASEGGYYGTGYASNWSDGNSTGMAAPVVVPEMERFAGKRGRNEIPTEIVEVNQAELMKNRPRADQAKVTGIAFGPAYQVLDLPQPLYSLSSMKRLVCLFGR